MSDMISQNGRFDDVCKKWLPSFAYKSIWIITHEGIRVFFHKLINKFRLRDEYLLWISQNENDVERVEELQYMPLISVVVPVYNVESQLLIDCIESVINQTYDNWELCLVDDCSTMESVRDVLKGYEDRQGVKVKYRDTNGHISKATNSGIKMATGEFVALLDCDDLLAPNALYEMVKLLNERPEMDFIYSDEDKVTEDGKKRMNPFFKPDWSPDTFMSLMYTCHFSMFRKTLLDDLGGMRIGLEGSQDYDLVLRVMEKTKNIGHVSKILYHWRERKESTAKNMAAKPYIVEATRKAKEDALKRRNIKGFLEYLEDIVMFRIVYEVTDNPKVSIIIPSKDNYEILMQCLVSIRTNTKYSNYEIIVVDNGSNEDNKIKYDRLCEENDCIYYYEKMEFNFSRMCNMGTQLANGDFYLFLNDDIEVIESEWLSRMLGHAQLSHIGAVGCKLIYPDTNLIQHAGIVSYRIGPGHAFRNIDDSINCYWGRNLLEYNYSAVTGACLLVEAAKFDEVDGFDENLPIAYNDVDLCFKLVEHGFYNVVRNDVKLYHYESISRGYDDISPEKKERQRNEMEKLYKKHPQFRYYDPCYNPNLIQNKDNFALNVIKMKSIIEPKPYLDDAMENGMIEYEVESFVDQETVMITGWMFHKEKVKKKGFILLESLQDEKRYFVKVKHVYHPKAYTLFNNRKLMFAGFMVVFYKDNLPKGKYKVYLAIHKAKVCIGEING